jgi:hypothetical protein
MSGKRGLRVRIPCKEWINICTSSAFVSFCVGRGLRTGDNQPKGFCQTHVVEIPKPEEMERSGNHCVWCTIEDKQHKEEEHRREITELHEKVTL